MARERSIGGRTWVRGLRVRRTISVVFLEADVLIGEAHAEEESS